MPDQTSDNECVVNAHAWQILRELQKPIEERIVTQVALARLSVRVEVALHDLDDIAPPPQYPGAWLSSTEQLIWRALDRRPLLGKQIAAAMGMEYGTRLKVLLSNLEERGVLTHDEATGYARAPLPSSGRHKD